VFRGGAPSMALRMPADELKTMKTAAGAQSRGWAHNLFV